MDAGHGDVLRQPALGVPLHHRRVLGYGLPGAPPRHPGRPRLLHGRTALRDLRDGSVPAAGVAAAVGVGADPGAGPRRRRVRRHHGVHRRRRRAVPSAVAGARVAGAPRIRVRRDDVLGKARRPGASVRGAAHPLRRPEPARAAHDGPGAAADRRDGRAHSRGHRDHHGPRADRWPVRPHGPGIGRIHRHGDRRRGDPGHRERPAARSPLGVGRRRHPRTSQRAGRHPRAGPHHPHERSTARDGDRRGDRAHACHGRALGSRARVSRHGAAGVPRTAHDGSGPAARPDRRRTPARTGAPCPG